MNNSQEILEKAHKGQGPKFFVDVEGTQYPWEKSTITPAEIRQLANLPADPVMLIDADNNERQLAEDEVVELKPGQGFAKRVRFKRG
jgi:Multiubiquitin